MNGLPQPVNPPLTLQRCTGRWAVCRFGPEATVPEWLHRSGVAGSNSGFLSMTRTDRELSIIAAESIVPADTDAERGWTMLRVAGTLDFNVVGVLARLTGALAAERVPVFVASTYDTDYLLIKDTHVDRAVAALRTVATIIDGDDKSRDGPAVET